VTRLLYRSQILTTGRSEERRVGKEPLGWVVTVRWSAAALVTVTLLESTVLLVVPPEPEVSALVKVSVDAPAVSRRRSVKVATPPEAATVVVELVKELAALPLLSVTATLAVASVPVVTRLLYRSQILTTG